MLFILFGTASDVGARSREYFKNAGFELIQKYSYVPDGYPLVDRYGKRVYAQKDEVLKCDFVYDNNGRLVGFNKEQIIDAVRGQKKCLLTAASETIDFIRQIKAAYGDYVTVLGLYMDEQTAGTVFSGQSGISPAEIEMRIDISHRIKQTIMQNYDLFDRIIIYGGEESYFNYDSMYTQYASVIRKAFEAEKKLNDKNYVEMPYSGNLEYVFVSYSHKDRDQVLPILGRLQQAGCRIWYDEGIKGGENWRKILASKIDSDKCSNFLLFGSVNSAASLHVCAEINAALNCEKKIVTVRLDGAKFPLDIEMYLGIIQSLKYNDPLFNSKLSEALDKKTFA